MTHIQPLTPVPSLDPRPGDLPPARQTTSGLATASRTGVSLIRAPADGGSTTCRCPARPGSQPAPVGAVTRQIAAGGGRGRPPARAGRAGGGHICRVCIVLLATPDSPCSYARSAAAPGRPEERHTMTTTAPGPMA